MLDEIKIAMKQLAAGKCPGPDGFPIEWFIKFQPKIIHSLHSLFKANIRNGRMHGSSGESIVALMEKLDKDHFMVENWRPLSMLNSDYKIYAKIIANRLQYVMSYLISQDQKGFMKGRQMVDNIIDLNTIIEFCNVKQLPALVTIADFCKAFDKIEWLATELILNKYGMTTEFIDMIMVCFRDFRTRVQNNGYFTEYIKITRGNKQGCPISSLIFNLVIEITGLKLKQNLNIKGIKINGITKIASQFAEDLWTIMHHDRKSFETQMTLFYEYEKFTGLEVNYNKTEIMWIGALRNSDVKFYMTLPIKWSDGPVKVLGIVIANNIPETTHINYEIAIQKIAP